MKRLYRSKKNKVIGGVLGGLGEYFEIDPVILRIILIVAVIVIHSVGGILILSYLVSMIILPYRPLDIPDNTEGGAKEISSESKSVDHQNILAWAFIIIGCISLFFILIPTGFVQQTRHFFWPVLLVLVGFLILINSFQRK